MSWEKEENKSRHVDFQCVKSKSITNLVEAAADTEQERDLVHQQVEQGAVANVYAVPPQPSQSEPYPDMPLPPEPPEGE